jgi:hypothetical protein
MPIPLQGNISESSAKSASFVGRLWQTPDYKVKVFFSEINHLI